MPKSATEAYRAVIEVAHDRLGIKPTAGGTVHAYINHDRWVADCPCGGAERVEDGHLMVCGSCGATHEVIFPSADEATAIGEQLAKRPPSNRNWVPGETVDELIAQNIEYGIWDGLDSA